MDFKGIFSNRWVKWGIYLVLAMLVAYAAFVSYERSKKRKEFAESMAAADDSDSYKAEIRRQAQETGNTFEERVEANARYLWPVNPFKAAKA